MINTLLAVKKGMTSDYDARGRRVGVTVLQMSPNLVTQIKKTDGKDGYNAVQIGLGTKKSVKKPQIGHLKKAGIEQKVRWLKEVRVEEVDVEPGKEISPAQVFSKGDCVKVTGISKGRGFQGGVKRYGFHGGPKTHGQSDRHRAPGSIGSGTTPGRVFKGKRMAGHFGVEKTSILGLEVVKVDKKNNLLIVKGGIPGANESLVMVQKLGRIKGYTPPPEEKEDEEEVSESAEVATEAVSESAGQPAAEPVVEEVKENA